MAVKSNLCYCRRRIMSTLSVISSKQQCHSTFYGYYENSNLRSHELCWHRSRSAVNSESCSQKSRITMISIAIGRKVQLRGSSSRFNFVYTGAVSCRAHRRNKYKAAYDPTWLTMHWLWLNESLKRTQHYNKLTTVHFDHEFWFNILLCTYFRGV